MDNENVEIEKLGGEPEQSVGFHTHNGPDSPKVDRSNFQNIGWQYNAKEFDNGSVATTATIDWSRSNVQYITLTGATTLTFINPFPGMRCILHIAGAFVPTFPSTVRWPAAITPTATATAGKKDVYSFVYSGKESLFDAIATLNFATT